MEAEPHKKCIRLKAMATPTQAQRIATHCFRLNSSIGARVLELLRRDILAHDHFDLQFDVGPTRKPRRAA